MCLDYPAVVTAVTGDSATLLADGRTRRASTLLVPNVRVGDWVHVAAGTILTRLSEREAQFLIQQIDVAKGIST
jgi:hydrogenase maturation factor